MTDREKMIDLIINAKRTDPETGSFTEYLADFLLGYGVKLPTSNPQPGKPLTLEQLEWVDEEPVFIRDTKYAENTGWVIWDDSFKQNWLGDSKTRKLYNKDWFAYSYPPAQQRWIPVSERLPERRRRVLCRLSYPDIEEIIVENQYYGNGMWMEESEAVTHWMPLPEPPEEG